MELFLSIGIQQFSYARAYTRKYISAALLALLATTVFSAETQLQNALTLLETKNAAEKINAIQTIKTFRQADAARALSAALTRENDPMVQLALLDGLGSMPEFASVAPVAARLSAANVAPLRKRAAYTLGLIGGRRAEQALSQALLQETDPGVKGMLLQSLSICASAESVPAIENAMKDGRPEVRAKAAEALSYAPGHRVPKAKAKVKTKQVNKAK